MKERGSVKKMSNVLNLKINQKKKKIESRVNDNNKTGESIFNKKNHSNVRAKNLSIFEIENSPTDEDTNGNLEIFHKKKLKESSLPSISEVLSTSYNNNILGTPSLLNHLSIDKPEKSKIKQYANNTDIFTSKIQDSTNKSDKQFLNIGRSTLLDKNRNKDPSYAISGMFSDDLSDKENFGQEFTYVSSSDDSQTDLIPSLSNLGTKKTGNILKVNKECDIREKRSRKIVEYNRPEICREPLNRKPVDSLCVNFDRNKSIPEILNDYQLLENPSEAKKESKKQKSCSRKLKKESLSIFLPLEKINSGTNYLQNNSVTELEQQGIENEDKNEQPCIVCKKTENNLISNKIDPEKCTRDIFWNDTQSHSIDIALSQCHLDHSSNAEDTIFGSIEMMDERAQWLIDDNNLGNENGTDSINNERSVLCESGRMNFNDDKNRTVSDLTSESIINSQDTTQLSDTFVEIINLGAQLSGQSHISSGPNVSDFDLCGNSEVSSKEKNLIHAKNNNSSFSISQAMYIKQRSPFFRQTINNTDENKICFKLCNYAAKEIEEFLPEVHLCRKSNHNASSDCKTNDSKEETEGKILNTQKQLAGFMDLRKEFTDIDAQISAMSNSMINCSKRHYSSDENSESLNTEMSKNHGIEKSIWSENQNILIDQFSCSSFNSESNIFHKNEILCSSHKKSFWSVSRRVHSFVKEWLDKNDEIGGKVYEKCVDRQKLSLKRLCPNVDRGEKEKRFNMEPEMLLSNYSSEYDRAYMVKRFKRN